MKRVLGNTTFPLLFFGVILTTVVLQFYYHVKKSHLEVEEQNSLRRAEVVGRKISEFVVTSNLVSQFVAEDLKGQSQFTQSKIEQSLKRYLSSSPSDLIYGIGIWFNPYKFDKKTKLFGPYVKRAGDQPKITYEWNTEEYNYPQQEWYMRGFANGDSSIFIEPYFDSGLVYVTNTRALINNNNEVIGAITVDLVLTQLQDLISPFNVDEGSILYIKNRAGNLLAHPMGSAYLETVHVDPNQRSKTLLDFRARDIAAAFGLERMKYFRQEVVNNELGWTVVVDSSEAHLLKSLRKIQAAFVLGLLIFWFLTFLILKNASDRKREALLNQQTIEMTRAQLAQTAKMAALGEMAASVAHEINNPLAIISAHAQALKVSVEKNDLQPEKILTQTAKIIKTVDRISSIIRGLRSFARSGENDPFAPDSLRTLVQDSVSFCSERIRLLGIDLKVSEVPDLTINCRINQLSQVLLNLLSNSADAVTMFDEKWISVDFEFQEDTLVRIYITDSGTGIPAAIVEKMMTPFYTTKEVGKGTGLGLSISKGIIEEHKGQLSYIKDHPHTRFCIELPLVSSKA